MPKAKTVFITLAPFENEIHNVLYTKELFIDKYLRDGYLVVVIVFCQRHAPLVKENNPNLRIIYFQSLQFINIIASAIYFLLASKGSPRFPPYMKRRWAGMCQNRSIKKKIFGYISFILIGWLTENCLLYLYSKVLSWSNFDAIYKIYNPSLTILPFYLSSSEEAKVVAIAKNNNSLTVAIPARISAFDDVFYYTKPDLLFVWNELMKNYAIMWHGVKRESIIPVGILKCDYYKNKNIVLQTKEEFINASKLVSGKKIISIICGNIDVGRACDIAKGLFQSGKIDSAFQVLLRANPDEYERQLKVAAGIKEYPIFLARGFSSNIKENKILGQIISTANFLKNSDLVISVASTMSLEFLYFDIPNIFLVYEEFNLYYAYDYLKPLLNEKGMKFVRNSNELISAVNEYLNNPSIDLEERRELFKKYCFSIDGDALTRCFHEINKLELMFKG